jgi:hypothetical protein
VGKQAQPGKDPARIGMKPLMNERRHNAGTLSLMRIICK